MISGYLSTKSNDTETLRLHGVEENNSRILNSANTPKARHKQEQDRQISDLPAELRNVIHSAALLDSRHGLPLLQTCRQIHMESTRLLHQRPISFSSQARLFSWITETPSAELKRIRTITLHLTDIDLSSLFDPRPIADKENGRSSSCWYLYSQELLRLDGALQSLPGLMDFTVIAPETCTSLVRGMYLSFLEVVSQRVPGLQRLTVYDQDTLLQKVPALRHLDNVIFLHRHGPRSSFTRPGETESREPVKIKMDMD